MELSVKWLVDDPSAVRAGSADDVTTAEQRLGMPVPAALREFHATFGGSLEAWSVQDHLFCPDRWALQDNGLVVARENQGNYDWLIPTTHLDQTDPPVMLTDIEDHQRLHLAAATFTDFVETWLLLTAKFSAKPLCRANGQTPDSVLATVRNSLKRLVPTDIFWPVFPTQLFGDDRTIVELNNDTWIWVTAQDHDAFEEQLRLAAAAPIEWESVECLERCGDAAVIPEGSNFYAQLRTKMSAQDVAELYSKAGWSIRKCGWTEFEVTIANAELVIGASPVIIHGTVANVVDNLAIITRPLTDNGVEFSSECYAPDGSLIDASP